MPEYPKIGPREERNNWPALAIPGSQPPPGWSHNLLAAIDRPRSHVVSPAGEQIAFFWDRDEASDLYVMPARGGWPRRLSFDREALPYWFDEPPQWSPDGEWLAYTSQGHAWVVHSSGGQPVKASARMDAAGSPRWLPDSHGLVFTWDAGEFTCLVLGDRAGAWPRPLTPPTGRDSEPQPSPDGCWVAYIHRPLDDLDRADLRLVRPGDGGMVPVSATPGRACRKPRWSPEGKQLAYTAQRVDFFDLYVYDPENGQERRLARLGCDLDDLAWSPDGSRLACTANREGAFDLVIIAADSGAVSDLRRSQGFHARPQWLAGSDALTFEYDDPITPADLYRIDPGTRRVKQLTFSTPPALAALELRKPDHLRYPSLDGLEIPAVYYRPRNPNGAGIVWPHGGPTGQHALEWDAWAQYMLAKGYTLLAPNFRGSTGYGLAFERLSYGFWGVTDTQDCLAAADTLARQPGIDPARLAIYGGSYGGYLAICAITDDPKARFACGVAKYGDCNLLTSWAQCERSGREDTERILGHPSRRRQEFRLASPVHRAQNVRAPLLIVHGLLDPYVPPQQSEELVEALRREGKTYEYKTYPDEGHGILRKANLLDYAARMERFLDWWLL